MNENSNQSKNQVITQKYLDTGAKKVTLLSAILLSVYAKGNSVVE